MLWVGLTGGLGTGKSTVTRFIRARGYQVIDADEIARKLLSPGSSLTQQVITLFGGRITDSQGQIDRAKLGQIVFKEESQLLRLESLLHPAVQDEVQVQRQGLEKQKIKVAFYDIPLLFEKKRDADFDLILVVATNEDLQLERVKLRNPQLSESEILDRIHCQWPIEEKVKRADYVIDNSSSLVDLEKQVDQTLTLIEKKFVPN